MSSLSVPQKYAKHCVKVMEHVYLGSRKAAKSMSLLESCGINHILNVTLPKAQGGVHNYFESDERFVYLRLPCVDSDGEDLSRYFNDGINFISNAIANRDSVLVHCQMVCRHNPKNHTQKKKNNKIYSIFNFNWFDYVFVCLFVCFSMEHIQLYYYILLTSITWCLQFGE